MTYWTRSVCALATALILSFGMTVRAQEQAPEALLDDFVHFVRIARPDLAQTAGEALMGKLSDDQLLDLIEAHPRKDQVASTLVLAQKNQTLKATADKLANRIQAAQVGRSREPQRIIRNIQMLSLNARARREATDRLRAAGQWAAPHMLKFLLDDSQKHLHPFILTAMVDIGRDLVYPLSVALPKLAPRPQSQIAQVLTEIGYPLSLPYFKQVVEDPTTEPNARGIVGAGYLQLLTKANNSSDTSAAELFFRMSDQYYIAGTVKRPVLGFDDFTKKGVLWKHAGETGLVPVPVPGEVFADVMTMESARTALALDGRLTAAHSLWISANLRRENRLPEGQEDPSYRNPKAPGLHARVAGPKRLHEVLGRALRDGDTDLARDVVAALDDTAGTVELINATGASQPLLTALSYPDRRVRFEAAAAMTNARPKTSFRASFRVVPVLAEAVRQTNKRYAVVISAANDVRGQIADAVKELGYIPLPGQTLGDLGDQVNASPGVDLIVIDGNVAEVEVVLGQSAADYQLAAVPVLAVVDQQAQIKLREKHGDNRRLMTVHTSVRASDPFKNAVAAAAATYAGKALTEEESTKYAANSLRLLRDISMGSQDVYRVTDAQPALIAALGDARDVIVVQSAGVLALLNNKEAQQALADAGLDANRLVDVRVQILNQLAHSIKSFGNQLTQPQSDRLIQLLKSGEGEVAIAAARVFGALRPETENVVDLITTGSN